jgi:predicted RNase H-like HicB family nuclease
MAMTAERLSYRLDLPPAAPPDGPDHPGTTASQQFTALAAFDGEQWSSLCRELDIASVGATAEEALTMVEEAVRATITYARETGRQVGPAVPNGDLREFLLSHEGPMPLVGRAFRV